MDDYTPNEIAYLDLINDISKAFCFIGEPDEPAVCDGDIKLLDKAVKKFKLQIKSNYNKFYFYNDLTSTKKSNKSKNKNI